MAEQNNYDRIAGSYDAISRLVFQKSIVRSQQSILPFLSSLATILIVGGGTGRILEDIAKLYPGGLLLTYLDMSGKMIARARRRDWKQNEVTFLQLPVAHFKTSFQYDFILTPFLFDNFNAKNAALTFTQLDSLLKPGGSWLFTDFKVQKNGNTFWQKGLLRCMYWFFRITARVQASQLPDMDALFETGGYETVFTSRHYGGFIEAAVYRRKGN